MDATRKFQGIETNTSLINSSDKEYITARKRYEQEVAAKVVLDKTAEAGSIDENRKEKILDAYKKILEAIKPIPTVPQLQPVSNGATTLTYDEALEHFVDTVRHTY